MTDNDQAAVEALCSMLIPSYGAAVYGETGARAILDAIRKGEVPIPGMVTEAVWRAAEAEVERLKAELSGDPRTLCDRVADSMRSRERALEVERDQLRAEVERLKKELDDEMGKAGEWIDIRTHRERVAVARISDHARKMEAERDAEKARADKAEADRVIAILDQSKVEAERDRLAGLLRELRMKLYDSVPLDRKERDVECLRIDAALAEVGK